MHRVTKLMFFQTTVMVFWEPGDMIAL